METLLKMYYEAPADISIAQGLKDAFAKANAGVMAADEVPSYRYMCTTLVAVALFPGRAVFVNVGDSRGYIVPLSEGAARQVHLQPPATPTT